MSTNQEEYYLRTDKSEVNPVSWSKMNTQLKYALPYALTVTKVPKLHAVNTREDLRLGRLVSQVRYPVFKWRLAVCTNVGFDFPWARLHIL
jgi:hypothetical protein